MAWLRLIRWQNLIIVALTQLLGWWCIVLPAGPQVLHLAHILLLTLSTVLITAAGYIINDYFDIRIDQVNHPERMVVGKVIRARTAIIAHMLLSAIALCLAGVVAWRAHHPQWLLLQCLCVALLWRYSVRYKRQYVKGNVVVALLTALTVLALIVYEPVIQQAALLSLREAGSRHLPSSLPIWMLGYYAYFAFMLTWVREIVKDMEDMEGDAADGCVTMPIRKGLQYATRAATVIVLLAILPLLLSAVVLWRHHYLVMAVYVLALLAMPLTAWVVYLWRGPATSHHYRRCSTLLKVIMLLGILSLIVHKYL